MENKTITTCPQPPSAHGRYIVKASCKDGDLTLSVLHVDRNWMPSRFFGRNIFTNVVRVTPVNAGDSVALRLTADANGLHLIIDGQTIVLLSNEWPLSLRQQAYDQIARALHGKSRGLSVQLHGTSTVFAVLVVGYMVLVTLSGGNSPAVMTASAQPSAVAPTAESGAAVDDEMRKKMEESSAWIAKAAVDKDGKNMPIAEALEKVSKIVVRPTPGGGKGIIVWSDPLCPHCRDLDEHILKKLPSTIGITMIPVSFKKDSRLIVSHIVCGADNEERVTRWTGLMSTPPAGRLELQCENGPAIADINSVMFARSGLSQTPTIMKADGTVFKGAEFTVAAIEEFLK